MMQTNIPGVFAAGDAVTFPLALRNNKKVNVPHWQMAHMHGRYFAEKCFPDSQEISKPTRARMRQLPIERLGGCIEHFEACVYNAACCVFICQHSCQALPNDASSSAQRSPGTGFFIFPLLPGTAVGACSTPCHRTLRSSHPKASLGSGS